MGTEQENAKNRWKRANVSYENYQDFISKKEDRFKLTLIDLLYISNFIGGNATVSESESEVNKKLIFYSERLQEIDKEFQQKKLSELIDAEINTLIEKVKKICDLTNQKAESHIKGFSITNLSALLSSYFSDLIPILNERVLVSLKIPFEKDKTKNYSLLIKKIAKQAQNEPKTLREIDCELYII